MFISRIVHPLLFAETREQYMSRRPQAHSDVDYLGGLFGPSPVSIPERTPDVFEPQALWTRSPLGISSCSNHVETLHRELNAVGRGHRTLASRLARVYKCLKQCFESASEFPHRQAIELLKEFSRVDGEKGSQCAQECG
jgi:hypothetical protein